MNLIVILLSVIGAEAEAKGPNAEQVKLLKTFQAEFVRITPGVGKFPSHFQMGRENGESTETPVRKVAMHDAFSIAKYEVPQNLWEAIMGVNPSRWKGPRNSVEMLTHKEAVEFCDRCTKLMRDAKLIGDDEEIRLPSEAEWEYTARAGTTTVYSFGDNQERLGDFGWSTENASGNDPPVGAKKPNPWGLYDVHGYLWEWCLDHAHKDYQQAPANAKAWVNGGDSKRRVIRGGSWKDKAEQLTSSFRNPSFRSAKGRVGGAGGIPADTRDDALGLRCVLAKIGAKPTVRQ
jgi:formylglycine-generating enzyme required for sulfatase activity